MGVAAMLAIHCPAFTKRPPNAWGMFLEGIWVWFCSMKIAKTAADQCPCRRSATAQQKSVKLRRLRQNDSPRRVPQFCPLGPENRKWQWLAFKWLRFCVYASGPSGTMRAGLGPNVHPILRLLRRQLEDLPGILRRRY